MALLRVVPPLCIALIAPACAIDASGKQAVEQGLPADDDPIGTDDEEDPVVDASASDAKDSRVDARSEARDAGCERGLKLIIRDFTEAHPDFEKFGAAEKGIVEDELGDDRKPVYANSSGTLSTSGADNFAQWYDDVPGVNKRLEETLELSEPSPGLFVYDSTAFFPIDGEGFGNGPKGIELPLIGNTIPDHNYLFTTEAHLMFAYVGGERFTFRGDDDMWVFINGRLALDLGGTHAAETATIDLDAQADELEIEPGDSYPMDIFHAERHTVESNYRIETTIDLSCVENVPVL